MKYLFFDIECSNCFNGVGKMCEFGYVITDENFNILSAQDIPMCPGKSRGDRFHLRDRMNIEDISLAYDEDYYYEQPELPYFYNRIKKLMEDKETICFAFSASNDIRYLYSSCKKYNLPGLNYNCYDVQKLAANYLEVKGEPGLKKCVEEIVGPHSTITLVEHLSRDDAKMEMMIMEAICSLNQIDSKTLLEQSEFAKINSINFIKDFNEAVNKKKARKGCRDYIEKCSKKDLNQIDSDEYKGKRFGITNACCASLDKCKKMIDLIHGYGGLYTMKYETTDVLIAKDEKDIEFIKEKSNGKYNGEFILLDDFLKMVD